MEHISFSKKITLLSWLLSVLIVYLHAIWRVENTVLTMGRSYLFNLQNVCVPMFFFISGYLFFRNFTMNKLGYKYKRRMKTLVIPYLIWNTIAFIYSYLIMKVLGANIRIPSSHVGVILSILNANYSVLWFVKHVVVFAVITPLIYFTLRGKKIGGGGTASCIFATMVFNTVGDIKNTGGTYI